MNKVFETMWQVYAIVAEFVLAVWEAILWFGRTPSHISNAIEAHKQNKEFDKLLDKHLIDEGFLDRITKG